MDKERLFKNLFEGNNYPRQHSPDANQQLIELEMQKRFINAREFGRITPDKNPDFLGNFDHDLPIGIFEMFISEKERDSIHGTIEDCFGTAVFSGTISDKDINFVKHYLPEKSSVNASKTDIIYEGQFLDGEYYGSYSYAGNSKYSGVFSLQRGFFNQT